LFLAMDQALQRPLVCRRIEGIQSHPMQSILKA
jgi:hypothetical protein